MQITVRHVAFCVSAAFLSTASVHEARSVAPPASSLDTQTNASSNILQNLPGGPLEDHTSQGTLWDPLQSAYHYLYDVSSNTFTSPNGDPTDWLQFKGHWGDDTLPKSTPGQVELFGQYKV